MLIGLSPVTEIISCIPYAIKNVAKSDWLPGHTHILCHKNNADVLRTVPDLTPLSCELWSTRTQSLKIS